MDDNNQMNTIHNAISEAVVNTLPEQKASSDKAGKRYTFNNRDFYF